MSNNIQAAWAAFKLDNGRKSTVNMWCDRGYCPLNFPFYLCTDPCHTRSYCCSLGFPVLFSTVCRVVNQLTLRPQRGDYGLRPLTPPLHDTTVTTTQADSYPVSAWPLQYAKEIKHTHTTSPPLHLRPLSKYWKVKSFFFILIYATNFDNLLPKKVYTVHIYMVWYMVCMLPTLEGWSVSYSSACSATGSGYALDGFSFFP